MKRTTVRVALLGALLILSASCRGERVPLVGERPPTLDRVVPVLGGHMSFEGAGAFDIAAGPAGIWLATREGREVSPGRLMELDPARERVLATGLELGGGFWPGLAVDEDAVWVKTRELLRYDTRADKVTLRRSLAGIGVAVGHGSVWTTEVARIDPATGDEVSRITGARGNVIVIDDGSVWVGRFEGPGRVSQIDPHTDSVVATMTRPGFELADLTSDGSHAWIAWLGDEEVVYVTERDPGSEKGELKQPIEIRGVGVVSDMVFASGRLWVIAYGYHSARLYQIDPSTQKLVGTPLELEGTALSVASTGDTLWISDYDRPVVTRVDLVTCNDAAACSHPRSTKIEAAEKRCEDPRLRSKPPSASIGERVELHGRCFTDGYWQALDPGEGYDIFLFGHVDDEGYLVRKESEVRCEIIAGADGDFEIDKHGRLRGFFMVPSKGDCFQSSTTLPIRTSGRYQIGIGCHTCTLAPFRVR